MANCGGCQHGNFPPPGMVPGVPTGGGRCNIGHGNFKSMWDPACKDFVQKTGCFIATACYGNYNAPEVLIFREYRDSYLINTWIGRSFIAFYYFTSPPIAKIIAKHEWMKKTIRKYFLFPILKRLLKDNEKIK